MRADCTSADSPALWRGRSEPVPESLLNSSGNLNLLADSPAQVGGRSAALTQNVPERVFSLVGLMICAADGPHLGHGRSTDYLTVCTRDIVVSGGFQG